MCLGLADPTVGEVAHGDTDHLLRLVSTALDEIDDRPVSVTARRTARIASMLGETEFAVRLGMELKPSRGHPPTNAEDTRRLMADPSGWGAPDGPVEAAIEAYFGNRTIEAGDGKGNIDGHGLDELEAWIDRFSEEEVTHVENIVATNIRMRAIVWRVRHSCFAALCAWERQLTYSNVNERIFERFRSEVDAMLAAGAPSVLDQFSAVFRRLREASANPEGPAAEDLAQAVASCRRILKAVADHVLPGEKGATSDDGHLLNDAAYRNRIYEYLKTNVASDRTEAAIKASVGGLFDRFEALDGLASKGVHADVGLAEAELCAIGTYLVAGELLRLDTGQG